jgi:pectate lyase
VTHRLTCRSALGALALAAAASAVGGCHDVALYPLRANPSDGGGSEPVDVSVPTDVGPDGPTDAGPDVPPTLICANLNFPVVGYASQMYAGVDGGPPQIGTTGGGNLTPDVVTTYEDLSAKAGDPVPRVIEIMGTITFPPVPDGGATNKNQIKVASNKTIVGDGGNSGLFGGGLFIDSSRNVIVRNVKISDAFQTDAITIQASNNVWVDHCDLSCDPDPTLKKMCDGLVDVTHASDLVTVSWTYYHDHEASGLVGGSDNNGTEDMGHLTVTYHHNFFQNVFSGPRLRFGEIHIFNNYFLTIGDYAIGSTCGAQAYIERNVFEGIGTPPNMHPPITTVVSTSPMGFVAEGTMADANIYVSPQAETDNNIMTAATSYRPPYSYMNAVDMTGSVQPTVIQCAGTGRFPPLPIPN